MPKENLLNSEELQNIFKAARSAAIYYGQNVVYPEHFLYAILEDFNNDAAMILLKLNVDLDKLKYRTTEVLKQNSSETLTQTKVPLSTQSDNVIKIALDEARALNSSTLHSIHLLLGILKEESNTAFFLLERVQTNYAKVLEIVKKGNWEDVEPMGSEQKTKTPALDDNSRDLTKLAREGKLDPVIGRDQEVERIVQILIRKKKNNPVLIGEPGVGKTSIIEGLALRIVNRQVTKMLQDKRVMSLDLASLVSGTRFRGQFEEKVKAILNEVVKAGNIILFIDELHTVVGAGNSGGALDLANLLKPMLARGEFQCIGATTLEEYRKYIEDDGALERRFQKIIVEPSTPDETMLILKNIHDNYSQHHHVKYTPKSLEAIVRLSDRYITDRYFPDKAIDVLDEAGSRVHLKELKIPEQFLKIEQEISKIEQKKKEFAAKQKYDDAANMKEKEGKLRARLKKLQNEWDEENKNNFPEIDENVISQVVSLMTGIPVDKISETETNKLLKLESELGKNIVGQNDAIKSVSDAIKRARTGLKDPNRPIGSFIFFGPTGTGKTATAKELANILFGSEQNMIRIDMSEYMEKFNVSRLIGSPPGYVGYDDGGQLTEAVRRKPYSVVLFDEIEKAHPDVFNILLQVLDDGVLTDSQGRKVNFKNTIIIMTSNLGTKDLKGGASFGFSDEFSSDVNKEMKSKIDKAIKERLAPEFVNRIDEIIIFNHLRKEHLTIIIDKLIKEIQNRLIPKNIVFSVSEKAKELFINEGYNEIFGARPLKRVLQKKLENKISNEMLLGNVKDDSKFVVDVDENNEIFFDFSIKEEDSNIQQKEDVLV
jgi:ATP-dependent Clp protease ATP-binding subunit ClpC